MPHVYEFEKHSRLGDIVVSAPVKWSTSCRSPTAGHKKNGNHENTMKANDDISQDPVYVYCDRLVDSTDGESRQTALLKYILKKYAVRDTTLLSCVDRVLDRFEAAPESCEWAQILEASMNHFAEKEAVDFTRPSSDTDKLKLKVSPNNNPSTLYSLSGKFYSLIKQKSP